MMALALHMNGEGDFEGTPTKGFKHGFITDMTVLEKGTEKGGLSVALRCQMDDGTYTIVETTWALMNGAVHAFETKHGRPV